MLDRLSRREFVMGALKVGAGAVLGDLALGTSASLGSLPAGGKAPVAADIEPLVRVIEDTPRERLFGEAAREIHAGTGPEILWAATLLAGARSLKPRPVGFDFHAVLVVNAAAVTSREARDDDRWMPLFWTMDNFKVSQARGHGWYLPSLEGIKVPPATEAAARFVQAMDAWDEAKADTAVTALARSAGAAAVAELFWRYGARDFRDIGHKAIYAAHAWRLLEMVGWRFAETVLRSLAFACLEHEGSNPAHRDAEADRPWRTNQERAARIRRDWPAGVERPEVTLDFWKSLRSAGWADSCDSVVRLLNQGVSPRSIWDACFLRAGELLMQQPGIVGVHCETSTNALHFAYETAASDETRRLCLLQAAAFLALFRELMKTRGSLKESLHLDTLEPLAPEHAGGDGILETYAEIAHCPVKAARKTLGWLEQPGHRHAEWIGVGRHLLCNKAREAHDYKFATALFEDAPRVHARWRNRFLTSSVFHFVPASEPDSDVTKRARAALGG